MRGGALRGVFEGEGLLPWELGGEPSGEAAGVAAMLAELTLGSLLLVEGLEEEVIHVAMGVGDESGVDAVVDDEEEAVLPTGVAHEVRRPLRRHRVAREEAAEVDQGDVELRQVGGGPLVVRPYELCRNVGLVL